MKRAISKRNPYAKSLASSTFRYKVVKSKKLYTRKGRNRDD